MSTTEQNQEVIDRMMRIYAKFGHLKEYYGHEPLEPANQFCKYCGVALFTQEYKNICKGDTA